MKAYSIIVPAYNESRRIEKSLLSILGCIEKFNWDAEIIVVNDGSTDDTAVRVQSMANQAPAVRLIHNPSNRGKGYSVQNGVMNASGRIVLFTDTDLSAPIEEAQLLFAAIDQGCDVAIGSRWLRPSLQTRLQPLYRRLLGRCFNLVTRTLVGLKFADTQCGFKAFTSRAARQLFSLQTIERWGFDPEILFIATRLHMDIREIPVTWAHDERSRISYFKDGARMLVDVLKIRFNALLGRYAEPVAVKAVES